MTHREFFELYYENLPKYKFYYLAYEEVERIHVEKFGKRMFKNATVFRATISRFMSGSKIVTKKSK
jgi:hypothetical protein